MLRWLILDEQDKFKYKYFGEGRAILKLTRRSLGPVVILEKGWRSKLSPWDVFLLPIKYSSVDNYLVIETGTRRVLHWFSLWKYINEWTLEKAYITSSEFRDCKSMRKVNEKYYGPTCMKTDSSKTKMNVELLEIRYKHIMLWALSKQYIFNLTCLHFQISIINFKRNFMILNGGLTEENML